MRAFLLTAAAVCFAATAHAQGDPQSQCVVAYESAQELRLDKKLVAARTQLRACMASGCPEIAQQHCATWLAEVEAQIPSVVLRFVERGSDRNDVSVRMDGQPLLERLDGSAIEVDPGVHTFEFLPANGPQLEERVTIAEGEKLRQVVVSVGETAPPAPLPMPPPAKPPAPPSDGVHPMAWVLYGLSAAGMAGFIGFGVHSIGLEDCAPACTDAEVDDVVLFRALADVSLGVGILALGGAIWITVATFDDAPEAPQAAGLSLGVMAGASGPMFGATLRH